MHRPSTDKVFVDIGAGVHVEYSIPEALAFIAEREAVYNKLCDGYTHVISQLEAELHSLRQIPTRKPT